MNLGAERDRLLLAVGCALIIHLGAAIGLGFVDWSSTSESPPLFVDLGDMLEMPEPESTEDFDQSDDLFEEPDSVEPEEPEEVEPAAEDPPPEPEPEPEQEFAPADPAPPSTDESESSTAPQPSPQPSPQPTAPTGPQGPTEDDVASALRDLSGGSAERESQRPQRTEPATTDDASIIAARDAARQEFEQLLEEERRQVAASAAANGESDNGAGDPEQTVSAGIRGLLGAVREAPRTPSAPSQGDTTTNGGDPDSTSVEGDGLVAWDGDGDRRIIEFFVPEMDGSDLRATGAPEARARITFSVDARGVVQTGSVDVNSAALTSEGRQKIVNAVSSWRFDPRPGTGIARGSIDFIFERSS